MKITDMQTTKAATLSFEIFPPKKESKVEGCIEMARQLRSLHPDFMSVTYGAGGSGQSRTVEVARAIAALSTPALAHLTCVGNTPDTIRETARGLKESGIDNVLALRGDFPPDWQGGALAPGLEHADGLAAMLKAEGFCVGAACYPEGHPESGNRDADLDNMMRKVDAGVDFLVTQMFFDNNMLYSYLYRLQSRGVRLPVHAGIMPIVDSRQVAKMVRLSNAYIPPKLLAFCDRFADDPAAMRQAGIAFATDQIIDLVSNGVVGIHIYTMNKPEVTRDIVRNVDAIIASARRAS